MPILPHFLQLSFCELDQSVDRAANELIGCGNISGKKTLLFVKPGPSLIIWGFALFRVGAIPVIIDPGMGLSSFLSCIKRTKPEAMVGISRAFGSVAFFPGSFRSVRHRYLVKERQIKSELNKKADLPSNPTQPGLPRLFSLPDPPGLPRGFVIYTRLSMPKSKL